jgi:hypothetical protein
MFSKGSCKCLHCGEMFQVDARNRGRQRYCRKVPCRKARKADSQRRWLSKPGNADYFAGPDNAARVRAWQTAHPGYWKKRRRQRSPLLQDRSKPQAPHPQPVAPQDDTALLQDRLIAQDTLIAGLISHLAGSVLQDDIAETTRRLHSRGRAVLGVDVQRSTYGKPTQTSAPSPPTAAHPAFV